MKKYFIALLGIGLVGCNSVKIDSQSVAAENSEIRTVNGTWKLEFVSAPGKTLEDLFPHKIPSLTYDASKGTIHGNDGCNTYSGPATFSENKVKIERNKFITTLMACDGVGDGIFHNELFKINAYDLSKDGTHLTLLTDDIATMRFGRVE